MICLFDINKRNLASPAKRIRTLPNIRQGMDGFCAALWAAGKDRHDLRRQRRSGFEGCALDRSFLRMPAAVGKKGKRVTLFLKE